MGMNPRLIILKSDTYQLCSLIELRGPMRAPIYEALTGYSYEKLADAIRGYTIIEAVIEKGADETLGTTPRT